MLAVLTRNPQSAAQLEEQTGLPAGKLLGVLTELELRGVCRACPGGRYCLGERSPQKSRDAGGTLALTGEQALVLTALEERPRSVAQLEECTGLPAGKLLGLLTELELQGLCQSCRASATAGREHQSALLCKKAHGPVRGFFANF